jgi:hypothetical protein
MEYDSSQRKYGFFHRGIERMPSAWNTIHHRGNKVFFHRGIEWMPSAWNTIHHRGNMVFFTEE